MHHYYLFLFLSNLTASLNCLWSEMGIDEPSAKVTYKGRLLNQLFTYFVFSRIRFAGTSCAFEQRSY